MIEPFSLPTHILKHSPHLQARRDERGFWLVKIILLQIFRLYINQTRQFVIKKLIKITLKLFSFVALFNLNGQSPQEDEVAFKSAIDWLSSKLDYVYYDARSEKWWTNTFYINENKEVTIKQISSRYRVTADFKNKNYIVRTFRIQDINPYSIEIKKVNEATGRFAKGELLTLLTYDGKPKIHKTINNRKATSTSFLHLSFPSAFTDSLTSYPKLVRDKFYEAAEAATKIYPINPNGNKKFIFETMRGSYRTKSGKNWKSEIRFENVLKITSSDTEIYFGYDNKTNRYYFINISNSGVNTTYFKEANDTHLILANVDNPSEQILIYTFNSFQLNGEWFYRL